MKKSTSKMNPPCHQQDCSCHSVSAVFRKSGLLVSKTYFAQPEKTVDADIPCSNVRKNDKKKVPQQTNISLGGDPLKGPKSGLRALGVPHFFKTCATKTKQFRKVNQVKNRAKEKKVIPDQSQTILQSLALLHSKDMACCDPVSFLHLHKLGSARMQTRARISVEAELCVCVAGCWCHCGRPGRNRIVIQKGRSASECRGQQVGIVLEGQQKQLAYDLVIHPSCRLTANLYLRLHRTCRLVVCAAPSGPPGSWAR